MSFHIVIPARLASTRLPAKPLIQIHGKPMIQWVYENALKTQATSVTVATDDESIRDAVNAFSGEVCMTSKEHQTGTDRIVEVCQLKQWSDDTIIVNCQGDEPLMQGENMDQVATLLATKNADMATLHKSITGAQAQNPNQVKLVCNQHGKALYFSRSILPFVRDSLEVDYSGHIGLYAYKVGFLKTFSQLKPCEIEQAEKLEQLRALYYGYDIYSQLALKTPGPGIDTQQDLDEVIALLHNA